MGYMLRTNRAQQAIDAPLFSVQEDLAAVVGAPPPQMVYCIRHERGRVPGGRLGKKRQRAHWHALPQHVVAYACGVLVSGGCTLPEVVLTPCDVCAKEEGLRDGHHIS